MNFLDRMRSSMLLNKRKSILLLLISCVLSALLLVAFCIKSTSEESVVGIRTSIATTVTVLTSDSHNSNAAASSLIPMDIVRQMEALDNVSESTYYVRTCAYASSFKAQFSDEQLENMTREKAKAEKEEQEYIPPYDLHIQGNVNTKDNEDFKKMNVQLIAGQMVKEGDQDVCLIHYRLAEMNHLALDSVITVKDAKNQEYSLKVIGIYYCDTSEEKQLYEANNNLTNAIYTDLETALKISGDDKLNTVVFSMKDPEKNERFKKEAKELCKQDKEHGTDYIFKGDDTKYKLLSNALHCTIIIANIVLVAVMFLGIVIITLLVAISMRDRDYEIGVLLSMGERKYKIILQLLGELIIPILIGGVFGLVIGIGLNSVVSEFMQKTVQIGFGLSWRPIVLMFVSALGLCLAGAILTMYKIIRYQPKDILMHIE